MLIKKYKASLSNVSPVALKKDISSVGSSMLGISLGSDNSEGERLKGALDFMMTKFEKSSVIIGDGVYHLTLQVTQGLSKAESVKQAILEGKQHYRRNYDTYQHYQNNHGKVIFLSSMKMEDDHLYYLNEMNNFYHKSIEFQKVVDDFATVYIDRIAERRNLNSEEIKSCKKTARDYLILESAMFCQLKKRGWDSLSYSGSIQTFADIANGKFEDAPSLLKSLPFISLRLKSSGWVEINEQAYA